MRVSPLVLALALPIAYASSGDRHPTFYSCMQTCQATPSPPLSPLLRALHWTKTSDCAYQCSHTLTDLADQGKEAYHQFYGKWAFHRLIAQEPASVLFSLGNLLVHIRGYKAAKRLRPSPLKKWLIAAAVVQINTWIWSAVFHVRGGFSLLNELTPDMPLTEKLDYFSALSTVAFTLLYALIRVLHLSPSQSNLAALVLSLFVLGHIAYVSSLPLFPYGYHVGVAIVLGLIGNLLWMSWSASFHIPLGLRPSKIDGVPKHALVPALLVVLTIAAMSLEVLDFPPIWRVIDAHSLWHAATIPLGEAWWRFLRADAEHESGYGRKSA